MALTVTANNQTKPYGSTLSLNGSEFTSTGLKNADAIDTVTLTSAGTATTAQVAAGPYVVAPTSATGTTFTASNYTLSYVNGALTVTPVALTVTANNQTKPYGSTLSLNGSEFTSTGLKNADAIDTVTLTSAGTATTAQVAPGPYVVAPTSATGATFAATNYVVLYVNGSLTVLPVIPPVTPPDQPPVVPLPVPPEDTPVVVLPGVTATRNNEAPVAGQLQLPDVPEQNSPTLVQQVQTLNQTATDPVLYVMQRVEAPPVLPVPDVAPVQTAPDAVLPTRARRQDRN